MPGPDDRISSEHLGSQESSPFNEDTSTKYSACASNIAVIGCSKVGKTTFVKCALDIKSSLNTPISCKKVLLEGSISSVRLLELDISSIRTGEGSFRWPMTLQGQKFPPIDGALLLFDITSLKTIEQFPKLLSWLKQGNVKAILVSTKCDASPKNWQVATKTIEALTKSYDDTEYFQVTFCTPETHKRCVSIMLRNLNSKDNEQNRIRQATRPRAATQQSQIFPPVDHNYSRASHTRATSEFTSTKTSETSRKNGRISEPMLSSAMNSLSVQEIPSSRTTSVTDPTAHWKVSENQEDSHHKHQSHSEYMTFWDGSSEWGQARELEFAPWRKSESSTTGSVNGAATLESLIDRLLSPVTTKQDSRFITIFLSLYGNFCTSLEILRELANRFERCDREKLPNISKTTIRLRYLCVLHKWTSDYSGDFSQHDVRVFLIDFMNKLSGQSQYAVAQKDIAFCLDADSDVDDESDWSPANCNGRSRASTLESLLSNPSTHTVASTLTADSSTEDAPESPSQRKPPSEPGTDNSATISLRSLTESVNMQPSNFPPFIPGTIEEARYQAQFLKPQPRLAPDKARWHQLMDIPNEDVALELTRIDWILYSSIRPRDLVRPSEIRGTSQEESRSVQYVNGMVDHFNHIAFWVANLLLIRDKPKHRALMLEKLVGVAWKLRYLNNYNSLGAVIAGINSTAVHRLSQTHAMVSPEARKQFMRLEILLGTAKSHSAYRLAWQNTTGPRIPFLPLHRRDLMSAEAGNKTVIEDDTGQQMINWKKFDIMGDVLLSIQDSQSLPYPTMKRNEEISRLVFGCRLVKDEDILFERSIELEAQGASESIRKKFGFFQR